MQVNKYNNNNKKFPVTEKKALLYTYIYQIRYGTKCLYAHGEKEIRTVPRHARYKTQICRAYHSDGSCPYGVRCTFIHDSDYTSERRDMNSPVSNASTNFGSTTNNSTSLAASIHEADSIWSPSSSFMAKNSKTTFPVVAMRNF